MFNIRALRARWSIKKKNWNLTKKCVIMVRMPLWPHTLSQGSSSKRFAYKFNNVFSTHSMGMTVNFSWNLCWNILKMTRHCTITNELCCFSGTHHYQRYDFVWNVTCLWTKQLLLCDLSTLLFTQIYLDNIPKNGYVTLFCTVVITKLLLCWDMYK